MSHNAVISGSLLNLSDNHIVLQNRKTKKTHNIEMRGRWLYCRKCVRVSEKDGIYLPEKSRKDTFFVTVLAKGTRCGKDDRDIVEKSRIKLRYEKPDYEACMVNDLEIMDRVACPEDHMWGITRSPYVEDDFLIHECVPIANFGKAKE